MLTVSYLNSKIGHNPSFVWQSIFVSRLLLKDDVLAFLGSFNMPRLVIFLIMVQRPGTNILCNTCSNLKWWSSFYRPYFPSGNRRPFDLEAWLKVLTSYVMTQMRMLLLKIYGFHPFVPWIRGTHCGFIMLLCGSMNYNWKMLTLRWTQIKLSITLQQVTQT